MERKIHTIDATNKILGRLAVEVATLLRGKQKPTFLPYKDDGDIVVIKNIKNIKVTGKKLEQKMYYRHSGYAGGQRVENLQKLLETKPNKVLIEAVMGMLPKNKTRAQFIKRLKFE